MLRSPMGFCTTLWYEYLGFPLGRPPSDGDVFPGFFLIWGNNAGTQNGKDLYSGLDLKTRKMLLGSFREQIETFGFAGRDRESGSALFFIRPFPSISQPIKSKDGHLGPW